MITNTELYFIHGWGFDNKVWDPWLDCLAQSIRANIFDRGYFKNRKYDFKFNISGCAKIVISHSFGLHHLSANDFSQIEMLVIISGFRYFHEYSSNRELSEKQIELMKRKLLLNPARLLGDFYSACGLKENRISSALINRELLYEDLALLNKNQIDLESIKSIPSILLLHGAEDNIINHEYSRRLHDLLPHSKLFINDKEGHALPLTDPYWCINNIQAQFYKKVFSNSVKNHINR